MSTDTAAIMSSGPSLSKKTNPNKNPLNPLNTIRTKVIYKGKHYRCTKADLNKTRKKVVRNYSCQMIKRRNVGGEWVVGANNKTPKKGEIMTTKHVKGC
jgi:hypothetical protein